MSRSATVGGAAPLVTIGAGELFDNYEAPAAPGRLRWRPGDGWPLFHPSNADPDGGYQPHPYTIAFPLDERPQALLLTIDYLVIAPRLPFLTVDCNGAVGRAYLRPAPARRTEIRLRAGLHTSLYAEGRLELVLPGSLFRSGENELTLTACDEGELLRVENAEAVKRLDRMASAAGFVYQELRLAPLHALPPARASLHPSVVYRRGGDGILRERCRLQLELAGPSEGGPLVLETALERLALELPPLPFGHACLACELADGPEPELSWRLSGVVEATGTVRRRRKWQVHVTPHAHTDIGYTHRQPEVAERLSRTIDAALAQPVHATYHLDCAWTLEQWLETRRPEPEALQRLAVSGWYVDLLTQTAALEDLIRNGLIGRKVLAEAGLASDFVTVVDVPSLSASLPALLADSGLPYLVHASNQDRGPFRVNGGLHRLSPYWWEGQAGGRVLVWLAKMYCELRKVCGSPALPDTAAHGLDLWLAEWERDDYLPDSVLLYGQEADNTDLDPQPAQFVDGWNALYEWPRLVFSDPGRFFAGLDERLLAQLPVVRGDGGAYWEDGCGGAAALTALARRAQADLPAAERLETLAALHSDDGRVPRRRFEHAWRQLLLWDEHTWGAFLSATDPEALLQVDQWQVKEGFARTAARESAQLLHGAASRHALRWQSDGREAVVWNPHSWPVSGRAVIEIAAGERLDAPTRTLAQTATQQQLELWLDEVPAHGYRRLPLRLGAPAAATPLSGSTLANEHYRLELDPERGGLASLVDRALGRELVDATTPFGLGQLLRVHGGDGTRLTSNRADLPEAALTVDSSFALHALRGERFAFGSTLTLTGAVDGGELELEWLLPDAARQVELRLRWRKEAQPGKEAAYLAFPFDLPEAVVLSDSQLGWIEWGADELPGACQEWLPLQTGILLRGEECALHLCSPDVPLFCVGDVVRGRWPVRRDNSGGRIFAYLLNNYWHTNYPVRQEGTIELRFQLTSGRTIEPAAAFRRGWQARRPLYAQRLSLQDFRRPQPPYTDAGGGRLAQVAPEHVALVALKEAEDGDGFVARFQEYGGRPAQARLLLPGRALAAARRCDLLERPGEPLPVDADGALTVPVPAFGVASARFHVA